MQIWALFIVGGAELLLKRERLWSDVHGAPNRYPNWCFLLYFLLALKPAKVKMGCNSVDLEWFWVTFIKAHFVGTSKRWRHPWCIFNTMSFQPRGWCGVECWAVGQSPRKGCKRFCRTSAEIAEIVFKYSGTSPGGTCVHSIGMSLLSGHWLLSWVLFESSLSGSSSGGLSCKQLSKGSPPPRVPNLCLPQFSTFVTKALTVSGSCSVRS